MNTQALSLQEQIVALEKLRYQYLLDEQYDKFTQLCHPELRYVHSSGKVDDFAGYTGKCNQGFYKYTRADLTVERVDHLGSVITIFAELQSEFLAGTELKKLHLKIASLWVQHEGEWKFFAYQPTAII